MSRKDDIFRLITNHKRRLQKLKELQALHGVSVSPRILLQIEDIESDIELLQLELQELESEERFPLGLDQNWYPGWILQPGQVLVGNYRIQQMTGSPGGMGQVFAAEEILLQRTVAIKVPVVNILLTPNGAKRFLEEARIAAHLGPHPNIVQIRACLTDPKLGIPVGNARPRDVVPIPFIVMEFLDGGDLAQRLKDGPLDLTTITNLFDKICSAIHYAHTYDYFEKGEKVHGIIHRDLKPENICFDKHGRVVVVDFGLARLLEDPSASGGLVGTPSHMAPEQWNLSKGIDHRTDVYALGIILFQMVTGHLPFRCHSLDEFMEAHLKQPPPDPRASRPDLPGGVALAILQALSKNKQDRFNSVEEFSRAVQTGFETNQRPKPFPKPPEDPPLKPLVSPPVEVRPLKFCQNCEEQIHADLVAGKQYCSKCGMQLQGDTNPITTFPSVSVDFTCQRCGSSEFTTLLSGIYCAICGLQKKN